MPRIRDGEFAPLFSLRLMLKDPKLAAGLIDDGQDTLPVLASVVITYQAALDAGWGSEDFSAVAHVLEPRIGRSLTPG